MTAGGKGGPFESFWNPSVNGKHNPFSLTGCTDKFSSLEKTLDTNTFAKSGDEVRWRHGVRTMQSVLSIMAALRSVTDNLPETTPRRIGEKQQSIAARMGT